jgi:hypothetical protein
MPTCFSLANWERLRHDISGYYVELSQFAYFKDQLQIVLDEPYQGIFEALNKKVHLKRLVAIFNPSDLKIFIKSVLSYI